METTCEYHNQLMQDIGSIQTNIKTILDNQIRVNGKYEKHLDESVEFRDKVKMLWSIVHATKWIIVFLFGTGVFYKWISR